MLTCSRSLTIEFFAASCFFLLAAWPPPKSVPHISREYLSKGTARNSKGPNGNVDNVCWKGHSPFRIHVTDLVNSYTIEYLKLDRVLKRFK